MNVRKFNEMLGACHFLLVELIKMVKAVQVSNVLSMGRGGVVLGAGGKTLPINYVDKMNKNNKQICYMQTKMK